MHRVDRKIYRKENLDRKSCKKGNKWKISDKSMISIFVFL